jgi:hypothetical protein
MRGETGVSHQPLVSVSRCVCVTVCLCHGVSVSRCVFVTVCLCARYQRVSSASTAAWTWLYSKRHNTICLGHHITPVFNAPQRGLERLINGLMLYAVHAMRHCIAQRSGRPSRATDATLSNSGVATGRGWVPLLPWYPCYPGPLATLRCPGVPWLPSSKCRSAAQCTACRRQPGRRGGGEGVESGARGGGFGT